MEISAILPTISKIILPSTLTFFILAFLEKKNIIAAIRISLKVSVILGIALGLNIVLSPHILGNKIVPDQYMNFTGQIAMLAFGLIFILSRGKGYSEKIGLLKIKPFSYFGWALLIGVLVCGIGWIEDFMTKPPTDLNVNYFQKFIFEMTLPGLGEEILFRGIILEIANSYFSKRWKFLGANFGLGLIAVSLPFGLGHIVSAHSMTTTVMLGRFISTFISALALGWLKEKTSSLPVCAAAHNIANTLGTFIDYLSGH